MRASRSLDGSSSLAAPLPTGVFRGSKSALGETAFVTVAFTSNVYADLTVTGVVNIVCTEEQYNVHGSEIEIVNANAPGDCVHDELEANHASLKKVEYKPGGEGEADKIEVTINIDVLGEDADEWLAWAAAAESGGVEIM
ncbi:hypothetical protein TeGR_g4201 [Tetraparma gracilis]|uniref:Uncharacterized protein n=1 Tax=Tetraparma gracilis TaxID=2962635 RepID=A0ABQ6NAL1_9STRA|nr:hypothetical protein TeGR_g4201 [Tetraparma gracilis]